MSLKKRLRLIGNVDSLLNERKKCGVSCCVVGKMIIYSTQNYRPRWPLATLSWMSNNQGSPEEKNMENFQEEIRNLIVNSYLMDSFLSRMGICGDPRVVFCYDTPKSLVRFANEVYENHKTIRRKTLGQVKLFAQEVANRGIWDVRLSSGVPFRWHWDEIWESVYHGYTDVLHKSLIVLIPEYYHWTHSMSSYSLRELRNEKERFVKELGDTSILYVEERIENGNPLQGVDFPKFFIPKDRSQKLADRTIEEILVNAGKCPQTTKVILKRDN
jgi:hypothetical protein